MLEMFSLTKSRTSGFDGDYNIDFELSRITIRWRVASQLSPGIAVDGCI